MRVFVKDLQEFVLMIDVYEQIVAITTQMRAGALRYSVVKWKLKRDCDYDLHMVLSARWMHELPAIVNRLSTSSAPARLSYPHSISACGVVGGSDKKSQLAFIELCNSLKDYS